MTASSTWRQRLRWLQTPVALAVLLPAGVVLWRQVHGLSASGVRAAWMGTSAPMMIASLLATAASFACLASYERFATQLAVPGRVPTRVALRVGFLSHAIASTLGFHAVTGGALRYHLYRQLGLGVADVARVVAIVAACVGAGVVLVSAAAVLRLQFEAVGAARAVAPAVLVLPLGMGLVLWARRGGAISRLPVAVKGSGALLLLALVEMTAAIGALYVLLPADIAPPLAQFVVIVVGAMLLGIVSHAPGGLGVFEASVLAALPAGHHSSALVALLLYRGIYNLLPFAAAMLVLSAESLRRRIPDSVRGRV